MSQATGIEIGATIRAMREERGLTQSDVEERTGLLRTYLSRVECGRNTPRVDTLFKLAELFEVSLGDFFPRTVVRPEDVPFLQEIRTYTLTYNEQRSLLNLLRRWTR